MTLTINTNISSLVAQRNLNNATNALNLSMERLTTGYKINHAKDNAAGYSIADTWNTQISSLGIATDNASTGIDMLTTAEQNYGLLTNHLQRIRDLTEQAANGTFGSASLKAIQSEIFARLQEIDRISANAEFNGIKLMSYKDADGADNTGIGMTENGLDIQVGLYSRTDSTIHLNIDLFKSGAVSALFAGGSVQITTRDASGNPQTETVELTKLFQDAGAASASMESLNTLDGLRILASACSGLRYDTATKEYSLLSDVEGSKGASAMIGFIDKAINEIASRVTEIGAAQNRVVSAVSSIDIQSQNLVSSLSTLRDTDVAAESSNYIQAQILQQASATLLATANQMPSIAVNLI